jgi:hypothetical protein
MGKWKYGDVIVNSTNDTIMVLTSPDTNDPEDAECLFLGSKAGDWGDEWIGRIIKFDQHYDGWRMVE